MVSGASKGIGRAIVKHFFKEGFDVAFCARNTKDLHLLKNELEAAGTEQKIVAIPCDMANKEETEFFAQQVAFEFEQVDVLVNNAGIFIPGKVSDEGEGVFETLMQTNLFSSYYLSRALLPAMKKSDHAHLFSVCSTASITAYPNGGSYSISKFGLLGMTKVLREELKPDGIGVTAVIPGATYTNSWEGTSLGIERFMASEDIAVMIWQAYQLSPRTVVEEILLRPMLGDI